MDSTSGPDGASFPERPPRAAPTKGIRAPLSRDHAALATLLDRRTALREAARRAQALTGADISLVGLVEEEGVAVFRSWKGTRGSGLHDLAVPAGQGLGGKVLATARPWRVREYIRSRSITHHFDGPIGAENIRAMLGVPVLSGERVIGTVCVARRDGMDFDDAAIDALVGIADATAVAVTVADRAEAQRVAEAAAERRRVAAALHDTVGALLFTIGAQVRDLRTDGATDPDLAGRLGTIERQVAEASTALRRSLAALNEVPPDFSMASTVAGDCRAFEVRTGVTTRSLVLTELPELGPYRRNALLTAVREALLNVEKHAQASSVVVTLAASDGGVAAVIADDGIGWTGGRSPVSDPAGPGGGPLADEDTVGGGPVAGGVPSGGIGLATLEERLRRLGGTLQTIGNEDAGLTVRAWVPAL